MSPDKVRQARVRVKLEAFFDDLDLPNLVSRYLKAADSSYLCNLSLRNYVNYRVLFYDLPYLELRVRGVVLIGEDVFNWICVWTFWAIFPCFLKWIRLVSLYYDCARMPSCLCGFKEGDEYVGNGLTHDLPRH
jgi:hypothetical protein